MEWKEWSRESFIAVGWVGGLSSCHPLPWVLSFASHRRWQTDPPSTSRIFQFQIMDIIICSAKGVEKLLLPYFIIVALAICFGLWEKLSINVGPMGYELVHFWSYERRSWSILHIWATNLIHRGPMSDELNPFWFYEQWNWTVLNLRETNELHHCWTYERRIVRSSSWPIERPSDRLSERSNDWATERSLEQPCDRLAR